jgi:prepilin-type processing-associated H-X9-DG protein
LQLYGWVGDPSSWTGAPVPFGYGISHTAQNMKRAADSLAFTEGPDWYIGWDGADYTKGWDSLGQQNLDVYQKHSPAVYGPVHYRHSEGVNVAFYDGHVSYMKKQDVFIKADHEDHPSRPGMWVSDLPLYRRGNNP